MKPRMWIPNPLLEEASHFLRSALTAAVASKSWREVWPLVSVLFDLSDDESPPSELRKLFGGEADTPSRLRAIERWAEQAAKPKHNVHAIGLVMPSSSRLQQWLTSRVRAFKEFDEILTEDTNALLALARGADIALAVKAHRTRMPGELPLPLIIHGPTGVGKELLARALHAISSGKVAEFGPLNCGGLPAELIESELFGHTAQAFTGATKSRSGIIETHGAGTVFLDEIGDTPPPVQVRLLRFLNDGEVRPVGADVAKRVSPWVICATHRDLLQQVRQGAFREDLLFRLLGNVVELPPLAARRADILPVLRQCLMRRVGHPVELHLVEPARVALQTYSWPGNLRELSQLATGLVGRVGSANSLVVELGMLPGLIRQHYFSTRPAAEQIVDLYVERAPQQEDPAALLRAALVESFATGLRSGQHPELRFALFVERLVESPLFAAIIGRTQALQAHAIAQHRREHAVRRMSDSLLQQLAKVDGHPIAPVTELMKSPPSEEGLPGWVRHLLTLGEEASLDNSNFVQALRELLGKIETLSPTTRSAVESLVSGAIEDIKASSAEDSEQATPRGGRPEGPHHDWEVVREDSLRFERYLRAYGTAVAMAGAFGVSERTVRSAAKRFGIELQHGGARGDRTSGSNRKPTGSRSTRRRNGSG